MTNIALFPVSRGILPIVKHIRDYKTEYKVAELFALPGTSLCGRDIGYADNRGEIGMLVSDSMNDINDKWDMMLIAEQYETLEEANVHEFIISKILWTLQKNKDVLCAASLTSQELEMIFELSKTKRCTFTYLPIITQELKQRSNGALFRPQSFVIFVGNIIDESNSFEIFLSLIGEITSRYKLNILQFSTNPNCTLLGINDLSTIVYSKDYTEVEKIYIINNYVKNQCVKNAPDVIIVHLAEPMMEFNDNITHGFGIMPYIISKAILPDYFICGMPYKYGYIDFIQKISDSILGRLGYGIDCVHLSNAVLDAASVLNFQEIGVVYAPHDDVQKHINENCVETEIPINNLLTNNNLGNLTSSLVKNIVDDNRMVQVMNWRDYLK